MEQSAVEWLELQLNSKSIITKSLFKQAKEMEKQQKGFRDEDMIEASKYGYNFHKTTQFPNQEFEDSCIRNTQQWIEKLKENKI